MYFLLLPLFFLNVALAQDNQFKNPFGMNNVVNILSNPNKAFNPISYSATCTPLIYMDQKDQRGGCPTLKSNSKTWNEETMFSCLQFLRKEIGGEDKKLDHDKVLKKLYALEPHEQELMGMVLTSYGEVRGANINESYVVMKTLSNRVKTAKERGCKNANALDAATQAWQFSVWNKSDPNWKKAVSTEEEEDDEEVKMKALLGAYKKYKSGSYTIHEQDKSAFNNITHFRTKNIKDVPDWGRSSKAIKTIRVNKNEIGASGNKVKVLHYYFKNVPWSFKYNSKRPQKKGEAGCY